jgi:hypothetical protein
MYEKIKSFAQITTSSLMATAMLTLALPLGFGSIHRYWGDTRNALY